MENSFPTYTRTERRIDNVIHVLGVTLSLMAVGALWAITLLGQNDTAVASVIIYGLALVAVFTTSAAYHFIREPQLKGLFRRLDHAAIFVKIAGTYTPFALISVGGWIGGTLLAVVWTVAAIGAPIKLFAPGSLEKITHWLYLAQGWALLGALSPIVRSISGVSMGLLITGGLMYTVGVGFHISTKLPFHNAIWHGLVLVASICMYTAVMLEVGLA